MRRWLSGLMGKGGSEPEQSISRPSIEAACREAVHELVPGARVEFPEEWVLEFEAPEGWGAQVEMDDLVRAVRNAPERLPEAARAFASGAVRLARPPEPSLDSVTAVVRTDRWLAGYMAQCSGRVLHRPLVGDLVEVLGHGTPANMYCDRGEAFLKLAAEAELWSIGRRNAERELVDVERQAAGEGLDCLFTPESGLVTSLLLTETFWAEPRAALAADEGLLLVARLDDPAAMERLRSEQARARQRAAENLLISTALVTREGGRLIAT